MKSPQANKFLNDFPWALPVAGVATVLTIIFAVAAGGKDEPMESAKAETNKVVQLASAEQTGTAATTGAAKSAAGVSNGEKKAVAVMDRSQVEFIIRDYLMKNPEIMIDVQQALETKIAAQREEQARVAMKKMRLKSSAPPQTRSSETRTAILPWLNSSITTADSAAALSRTCRHWLRKTKTSKSS